MALNATSIPIYIYIELLPVIPNFTRLALQSLDKILEVFDFSIGYNHGEFEILEKKSLKIRNSTRQKSPKNNFVRTIGEKIQ